MSAEIICLFAFIATYLLRKRGPVAGILAVVVVGALYGILRANFRVTASYFIFDSALLALFTAELATHVPKLQLRRERRLREWVIVLMVMPALLLLLPLQDPLVQLVGFRSAVMFLPFFILGSRLDTPQFVRLGVGLAVLSIVMLGVAVFEFTRGIEMLFPRSSVTELIYKSNDVVGGARRIPATFSNSASYGSTMALSLPLLSIAVTARGIDRRLKTLCLLGIAAALIGVFMSAFRSAAVLASVTMVAILFENRRSGRIVVGVVLGILCTAVIVRSQPRLQRFATLTTPDYVSGRVSGSVNLGVAELITRYPFGNGLGAGGTSMPYFLQSRVNSPVFVENEYARLVLEQGVIGLAVWLSFLIWVFSKRMKRGRQGIATISMRAACLSVLATGMLGTGLLAAIPSTILLFLMIGFLVRQTTPVVARNRIAHRGKPPVVTDSSSDVVLAG
jgi:hypothetical protein